MSLPAASPPLASPRSEPSPPRRAFQTTLALAGWVVFGWWWWIALHRVSRVEIAFTMLFITISLVVVVGVTLCWIFHNLGIFKAKGPRLEGREIPENFTHDALGRVLCFEGGLEQVRIAPIVAIQVDQENKFLAPLKSHSAKSTAPDIATVALTAAAVGAEL